MLYGNLAPDGSVVKKAAVDPSMLCHTGPARVFDSEETACAAINGGAIVPGDVVVIRYEGPAGGPGMREMLAPTSAICGMGLSTCLLYTSRPEDRAPIPKLTRLPAGKRPGAPPSPPGPHPASPSGFPEP